MLERNQIRTRFEKGEFAQSLIDAHTHAGFDHYAVIRKRYPSSQSIKDLVLKLESSNIDFAVTFPCPNSTYYFDLRSLPTKEQVLEPLPTETFPYEFSNRQLMYEVSLFGNDRVFPFAIIFPGFEEGKQIKSLRDYIKKGLLFGLKHHTLVGGISAKNLIGTRFIDLAKKNSLPIMIHSGVDAQSRPENIMDLAEEYPDVRFCIAHAGEFEKSAYERFSRGQYDNLYFDCSPFTSICFLATLDIKRKPRVKKLELNYEKPEEALTQLYNIIPDNLIWGTDEPWTTITDNVTGDILLKVDYQDEVKLLKNLPKDIRFKIGNRNTLRFLFGGA